MENKYEIIYIYFDWILNSCCEAWIIKTYYKFTWFKEWILEINRNRLRTSYFKWTLWLRCRGYSTKHTIIFSSFRALYNKKGYRFSEQRGFKANINAKLRPIIRFCCRSCNCCCLNREIYEKRRKFCFWIWRRLILFS